MTLVSDPLPLGDHRARVLQYLRGIALPFSSLAGQIVEDRLSGGDERDLLRPTLVLWAARACGGNLDDAVPVAGAFALFDQFTLLHDELVEAGPAGGAVARWGLGQSLNAGDALYALALRSLAEDAIDAPRRLAVAELAARSVLEAIEGRNIDVELNARGARGGLLAAVRSMRRRSATLTGAAVRAGALLAGAPERVQRDFERVGRLFDAALGATDASLAQRLGEKAVAVAARSVTDRASLACLDEVVRFVAARSS